MGRYTGPSCRKCRREGMKLFLKGTRCHMAKCPIETGRSVPGMHGQRRGRKQSEYSTQLREKQRMRFQYGMQEGQFRLTFQRALQKKGITGEQLLQALESRLDNVVFRLGLAPSRRSARQFVTHRHVLLNGRTATVPSMHVKAGTTISVRSNKKSREIAARSLQLSEGRGVPKWMTLDAKNFQGTLEHIPTREEIAPNVNEQLVVELYSK